MVYYKAVWINEDDNKAVSYRPPTKELEVNYTLGREVVAPVGGLLVFRDLPRAREFCWKTGCAGLLRCTGGDPVPLPEYRFTHILPEVGKDLSLFEYDAMVRWLCEELWERGRYHRDVAGYETWPEYTIAVRRLVPEEWLDIN